MSNLAFYWDRSDEINLIDLDDILHFDDGHPILKIFIEVENAGYKGVAIDEQRLTNGRCCQILSFDHGTPEGVYLAEVLQLFSDGLPTPNSYEVLETIREKYSVQGGVK